MKKQNYVLLLVGMFSAFIVEANEDHSKLDVRHSMATFHFQNILYKGLLDTQGQSADKQLEALKNAEIYLEKFATQPRYIVPLATQDAVQSYIQKQEVSALSLEDELGYRYTNEPNSYLIGTPESPESAKEFDRLTKLVKSRFDEMSSMVQSNMMIRMAASQMAANGSLRQVENYLILPPTPAKSVGMFNQVDDSQRQTVIAAAQASLARQMAELSEVGTAIAQSDKINYQSQAWRTLFKVLINDYFQSLDNTTRKSILSQLLDLPYQPDEQKTFEIMVMNSGPQFQKLLQMFGRDEGFSPELRTLFKRLESNTKTTAWRYLQPEFEQIKFQNHESIEWIDTKPLGVGTMAQVHKARMLDQLGNSKKVVVRFLKPNIEDRVRSDNQVIRQIMMKLDGLEELRAENLPLMTPFMDELEQMAIRETDVQRTIRMQEQGAKVYSKDLGGFFSNVPRIYRLQNSKRIMVQEMVQGTSFEEFAHAKPTKAKAIAEALAELWVEEALYRSGFYHADLHQGNMKIDASHDKPVVHLLDYGMAEQLNVDIQNRFLTLAFALRSLNADLITRAMWALSLPEKNRLTQAQLKSQIDGEIRQLGSEASKRSVDKWIGFASAAGVNFIPEFSSFNRGVVLISQLLTDSKSTLRADDIMTRIASRQKLETLRRIRDSRILNKREILGNLLGGNADSTSKPQPIKQSPQTSPQMCSLLF